MRYFYLCFFAFALASFFFGTMGIASLANLRLVIIFPMLVFAIVKSSQVPGRVPSGSLVMVWAFLGWCLITCFWSENVNLSLVKLLLFSVTVMAFFLGGAVIPKLYPRLNPYLALAPVFLATVLGALLRPNIEQGNLRGIFGNSNMQAATILFTCPWLFVEVDRQWSSRLKRNLLLLLGVLATAMLLLSRSRTMLLSSVAFFTVVFGYLRPGRKVLALYAVTVLLMLAVAVKPELVSDVTQTYILKSGSKLMESRGNQIQESFQSAMASGPLGLGFGVSAGISRFWESGNFSSYSREKGNSILAVWEETGIIGAGLWLATMLVLALSLRRMGKDLARGSSGRFVYFVALGCLCGCFVSSMGEAWVLSPSPETAVFWAAMGIGFGALKADANTTSSMGVAA